MRHPQTQRQGGLQPEAGAQGTAGAVCGADGAGKGAERPGYRPAGGQAAGIPEQGKHPPADSAGGAERGQAPHRQSGGSHRAGHPDALHQGADGGTGTAA